MPSEDVLCARPGRDVRRFELSDHLPSTNDDEGLSTVLDGIEQVREASRCFRRGDLRHKFRLSEMCRRGNTSHPERQFGPGQLHGVSPSGYSSMRCG